MWPCGPQHFLLSTSISWTNYRPWQCNWQKINWTRVALSLSRCFFNETLLDVIRLQRRRKDSNRFPLFSLPSNYLSFKLTLIQFGISPTDFAWERKRVTSWKTAVYSTRNLWGQCRNLNSEIWALHLHINIKPKFNSIQF